METESRTNKKKFEGFFVPNSTQVPDTLFDELLSELSGAELKVVLYVIRRTFGFKKSQDNISLRQMIEGITTKDGRVLDRGTGLGKASVARAIITLEGRGIILRNKRKSEERGDEATTYSLKLRPLSHYETPPDTILRHPRVSKRDTQYTVKQYTVNNVNVNGYKEGKERASAEEPKTDLRKLPSLNHEKTKTESIAKGILDQLGDQKSFPFYYLVASKIPERDIFATLSSVKHSGTNFPAKVFVSRMKSYAAQHADTRTQLLHSAMQEIQKNDVPLTHNFVTDRRSGEKEKDLAS